MVVLGPRGSQRLAVGQGLAVGHRLVIGGLQPGLPGHAGFRGQKLLARKALLERELQGALADQQHVRRLLHHPAGDRDGVGDVLDGRHRAAVPMLIHDAGVECDVAVAVGIAGLADAMVLQVRLGDPGAGLDRVQGPSALGQHGPGRLVGRNAEIPGRDHAGTAELQAGSALGGGGAGGESGPSRDRGLDHPSAIDHQRLHSIRIDAYSPSSGRPTPTAGVRPR